MTEATKPRTVDGEVVHILAQFTTARALIQSCDLAQASEDVARAVIVMGEAIRRLETVSERLSLVTDLAMEVAKDAPADVPAEPIPQPLEDYLNDTQRAVYTLDALLTGVVEVAYKNSQDDIEWSLRHIKELTSDVADKLDIANVRKACEVRA